MYNTIRDLSKTVYTGIYEFIPHGETNGQNACVAYGKNQIKPWALGYCGRSRYFSELSELAAYATEQGYLYTNEIGSFIISIMNIITHGGSS